MEWYFKAIKNYANFKGRARRKEYWIFTILNLIIISALYLLEDATNSDFLIVLLVIYYLFMLIPSLSVTVRRLHDIGHSGWMYLVNFIPLVGGIILLILTCLDSEANDNKYGANPKVIVH